MPVYLDEMARNTAKVTFAVGGGEANIVYRPALITEETFAKLQEFERMDPNQDVFGLFADLNEMIVYLVESWDIYRKKNELFPLDDAKALRKMPLGLRLQIIMEIMGDFRPELPGGDQTQNPT